MGERINEELNRARASEEAKDEEIHCLRRDLEQMTNDRDEVWAEKDKEIVALKADNAALLEELRLARSAMGEVDDSSAPAAMVRAEDRIATILRLSHPGAAMLEQLREKEETFKALLVAVNDVLNYVHCHTPNMGGNHRYRLLPGHGPAVSRLQGLAGRLP